MIVLFFFPFIYNPYTIAESFISGGGAKNDAVSGNYTSLAIMVKSLSENMKQNFELLDLYKEMADNYFNSLKKISLKWLENEEEKNLKTAFFLSHNMQSGLDQVKTTVEKKFKSEEERDKTLSSLYF